MNVPESVLTALGNGDLTVSATVTNGHGNTGTGERDITIDASLPGLRVNTVAGDDVINSIEHGQNLIVSGTSDGLAAGTTLTVTVNGKTYAASVLADGSRNAAIPAADVAAFAAGTVTVTVAGQSAAGNPVTISHDVTVDLAAVAISIDAIATDDVITRRRKAWIWCSPAAPRTWRKTRPLPLPSAARRTPRRWMLTVTGRPPCLPPISRA
ncbi:Ig-like domain-containing protein [Enterobacter hormaechei]|uniref:Ig-like domain-containing protein n=1 Tax=Enterobacter hormaechei TaxID=158836 RepID=A0A4Y5ZNF9_9ENTR|nr:Ig-like domain-containing protein [Enterobacter hormaechei]